MSFLILDETFSEENKKEVALRSCFTRDKLRELYLYFYNNYQTVEKFAEHQGLYVEEATALLACAKSCLENNHPDE